MTDTNQENNNRIIENISIYDIEKIPYGPGVYIITKDSGEKYVGSSGNIRSRLAVHRSSKELFPIASVTIYITRNHAHAEILEGMIIRKLDPDLNKNLRLIKNVTDRQKEILKYAYYNGYFDTPKKITLKEISKIFSITIPTTSEILKNGQRRVFENYFREK